MRQIPGRRNVASHRLLLLALLLGGTALAWPRSVRAADADWTGNGADSEWSTAGNWSTGTPPASPDTAGFDAVPSTYVSISSTVSAGTLLFAPTSDSYYVDIYGGFTLTGGGILNNAANSMIFSVNPGASLAFTGGTTTGQVEIWNSGSLSYTNASAGSALITNNATIDFNAGSDAGSATINNQSTSGPFGTVNFNGNSSAGSAVLNNNEFGTGINFKDTSTAANATITNTLGSSTTFYNNSSAGNATITNNGMGGSGGGTYFYNTSTAGTATITNSGGTVVFNDNASAGNATITNDPTSTAARSITFNDSSTAGSATLTTGSQSGPGAGITFFGTSMAGSAAVTANAGGSVTFQDSSSAQQATLTANNGGTVSFRLSSSGGDARLVANSGGTLRIDQITGAGTTAGSIEGTGTLRLGSKRLTVGSNGLSTTFGGVIQGSGGALDKVGGGTLTLSGVNTYTGATTVDAGALIVDGSVASSSGVSVNAGGTLGGSGTVSSTTVAGTLAPGNGGIGTLTVNGTLAFAGGATYAVDVSPAAADLTAVTGTATLAGTVRASFMPGSYIAKTYTILTSAGRGGSAFDALTTVNLPAGFSANLSYSATDAFIDLTLAPARAFSLNGNQASVAAGIASAFNLNGGLPGAFTNLTPANLTQLSGENGTGAAQASLQVTDLFLGLMLDRFSDGDAGAGSATAFAAERPLAPAAAQAYAAVTPRDRAAHGAGGWRVRGTPFGSYGRSNGNDAVGSHAVTSRAAGMAVGLDYRFADDLLAGVSVAGAASNWNLAENLGGGRSDVLLAGLYAAKRWGAAYASAAVGYGWHDMHSDRFPSLAGGDRLSGRWRADTFGARVETGHRFTAGAVGVTPYGALQVRRYHAPGYAEAGSAGGTFALAYAEQTATATGSELGAWIDHRSAMDADAAVVWRARAAWAHEFNPQQMVSATFTALPGSTFNVTGADLPADALLLSAAVDLDHRNGWAIGTRVDGKLAGSAQSISANATFRYRW